MRPSSYLNTVEIGDGNSLLYNGFTMCMDVVPSAVARRLIPAADVGDIPFLSPAEKEHLAKRGHLTPLTVKDEQEEMGRLAAAIAKRDLELNRQPVSGRLLTFVLTYQCNLSCAYCYQNPVRDHSAASAMTVAFVDDFFRVYLDKLFPGIQREKLRFILFGGEPFLPGNRSTIERILSYAKEHAIVVSTATNAVLLPGMVDLIGPEAGKIKNVQVTLDGGQGFHDETRISRSGDPTFQRTISALRHVIGADAKAIVRIHLHPDGFEAARVLIDYLDEEKILGHPNVEVYFAPVHSFHTKDMSRSDQDIFSGLFQFVALKQGKPPVQNFDFLDRIMDAKTARNWSQPRYCAVSAGLHRAVDGRGDVYECLEEAGFKERRIGILSQGEIEHLELGEVYKKRYLANMPECLECSIALFCGGGCISQTRTRGGACSRQFCAQNKVFVGETLKAYFLLRREVKAQVGAAAIC